jgi:hypothetical protein
LVRKAVVTVDPFARRAVVVVVADLGHGAVGGDVRYEAHVRMAGAPGAHFAVCWRAWPSSAAGEESYAAVFLLPAVHTQEGKGH